jgi:hypothetical protein
MSLPSLRLAAARHALHLATPEELIAVADVLLTHGVYSYGLGELGTSHATSEKVVHFFLLALREFHIPVPDCEEAAATVVRHCLYGIAEAAVNPLTALDLRVFLEECAWPDAFDMRPNVRRVPGGHELLSLIHCYCPLEEASNEEPDRAHAEFSHYVEDFAARWILERAPALDPAWLSANGGAVASLARAIAEGRRFDDLPVLADALEEAGCTDVNVLTHCRDPGEHVARCWVLELLLGED